MAIGVKKIVKIIKDNKALLGELRELTESRANEDKGINNRIGGKGAAN